MTSRFSFLAGLIFSVFAAPALAGNDQEVSSATDEVGEQPYKFPAEFTIEQAYLGGADVQRGTRSVKDFDEYYSNLVFVYTPRIKFGILRFGAQWERYSFGFPDGGQQLPNTLQALNSIVGLAQSRTDLRLQQRIKLHGRLAVDAIAEVFNMFNRPNWTIGSVENRSDYLQHTDGQYRTGQVGFRLVF